MRPELSHAQQSDFDLAYDYYGVWDGDMSKDSITATIHMHFYMNFARSLFHKYDLSGLNRLFNSDSQAF